MDRRTRTAIIFLWLFSIAASVALTWITATRLMQRPAAATADSQGVGPGGPEGGLVPAGEAELQKEKEDLAKEVARLREQLSRAIERAAELASNRASITAAPRESMPQEEVERIFWADMEACRKAAEGGGMFDWLEELVLLVADMASIGDAAIPCLAEVTSDPRSTEEELGAALWALAFIPGRAAFDQLMALQGSETMKKVTGSGWDYEVICFHVRRLPKRDVEPYLPQIRGRMLDDTANNKGGDDMVQVGAALAFKHRDEFSLSWLEGLCGPDVTTAIKCASLYHTEEARQFLDRLQKHPEESIRTDAAEALAAW